MLEAVLKENSLPNKPQSIFNIDESGLQLINKPGKVLKSFTKGKGQRFPRSYLSRKNRKRNSDGMLQC
jgi:hypothetical protein